MTLWVKQNKVTVVTILILAVALAWVYLIKNSPAQFSQSEFEKKQECSQYTDLVEKKIKESGRVFENDTYTVKEIFYSPELNSCIYAWVLHTAFDPTEIYSIDDLFGGAVFTAGISENAEDLFYREIMKLKQ